MVCLSQTRPVVLVEVTDQQAGAPAVVVRHRETTGQPGTMWPGGGRCIQHHPEVQCGTRLSSVQNVYRSIEIVYGVASK